MKRRWLTALLALMMLAGIAEAQLEMDYPVPPGAEGPVNAFTRLDAAGTAENYEDADYVIVLEDEIHRVVESGVTYVDLYTIYKVLNDEGAKTLSALRWNYDPQSAFNRVVEVNVLRDGKRIPVAVDKVLDLPAPQSMIYWSDRMQTLQLPRLQPGDGIEVRAMRKGYNYALLASGAHSSPNSIQTLATDGDDRYIPPMPGEYFDIVLFQKDVPLVEKRYTLTLPKSKRLNSKVFNGPLYSMTDFTSDSTIYTWWALDVPARAHEVSQPDASDDSPKVVMTTAASWEQKSQWFWDVNKNQFEVTDAIRAKVKEILAEAGVRNGSDLEKAKAINHWVAQNIRYSGQTMGDGEGFTLHPSDMLFENRSGVCKDIASMSITMLRAAGMKSWPAMTMAGSRIDDIPADQFNHCVVALETDGRFVMLDPTWVPFNNDIWSKLETEQHYVIGHPDGVDLQQIRYSPPSESPLKVTHTATLEEDGTLKGTIRLEGEGAMDSRMRRFIYQRPARDVKDYLEAMLAPVGENVEVAGIDYRDELDFTGGMWLALEYTIHDYAMTVGDGLEFTPPMVNMVKDHALLFRAGSRDLGETRQTDVFLYYTEQITIDETITLPKGYKLVGSPKGNAVDETYAMFNADAGQKRRNLNVSTSFELRRRQIPPDGYVGLKKAMDEMDNWAAQVIRVSRGGA